jgi:uncharacterized protein (TIGR00251 family)
MRVSVKVKPGSKKGPLVETDEDGSLIVFLRERAVDGAANEALVKTLAKHFETRSANITIESGHSSRLKRVRIED